MLAKKQRLPARKPQAPGIQHFQTALAGTTRLDRATEMFGQAIEHGGATGHQCSRLVLEQHAFPLFGDAAHHGKRISELAQSDTWDIESPAFLPARKQETEALLAIPVQMLTGDPLVVSIGFDEGDTRAIDMQLRAQLHGLAVIYAQRAVTLWEIEEDIETVTPLTLKERLSFAMLLCGLPPFEIALEMDCSPAAVSAFIQSATGKLKTADTAAAVALAARRGWLHIPHELAKHQRGIDS